MMATALTEPGAVQRIRCDERTLWLDAEHATLTLTVLTPGCIRVRLGPGGTFAPRRSWAVTPPDTDFAPPPWQYDETPALVRLRTEHLTVQVDRATGALTFADAQGTQFCTDAHPPLFAATADTVDTVDAADAPLSSQFGAASRFDARLRALKTIPQGARFYGFGERGGPLEKRGYQLMNWTTDPPLGHGPGTDPLYMALPVLLSVQPGLAFGLFFNNTWRSRFDIGHDYADQWAMEAEGGELDYYVVYGPQPADVSAGLAHLLGTMPMPPRWAIGYHQCRWGYDSAERVREVAEGLRTHAIPADAVYVDIDYMDGYRVFTWDAERFPDPSALTAELHAAGLRLVAIVDPGVKIDPQYTVYQQGLEGDMFVRQANGEVFQGYVWPDDAAFPDFTRPDVRAWWGEMQAGLLAQGVDGIWNDMNEPTSFDKPFSTPGAPTPGTLPLDAQHGPPDERASHAEVHNLYGSLMSRACYEGQLRARPDTRPFVITRSGFAGVQRWACCWAGDNHSWWEHLEMALPQLMNLGLSGMPFVGTDIGGFFVHTTPELLVRWIQFGALSPLCRNHTVRHTRPQEPWAFGEPYAAMYRHYVELRYRLLPYLYTLFHQAATAGMPLLRPLFYHFPDDAQAAYVQDQVLCGPSLLAAPVYRPGVTSRAVYLPAGTWYDWWTGEALVGPAYILADAPLERMPLYVRAGTVLPCGPQMPHTDAQALAPLTLEVFPGDGSFTLYEDDGATLAYTRGQYCTTTYTLRQASTDSGAMLTLEIGARVGDYTPAPRDIVLRLHTLPATAHAEGFALSAADDVLTGTLPDDGSAHTLTVRW